MRVARCHHERTVLAPGDPLVSTRQSPPPTLARHLRTQDLPAGTSRSAGAYLCNFLYYLSLDWARAQGAPCDVTFVHLPPGPRQGGPLSEAELLRGAELILRYLLAFAQDRDGANDLAGEMAADATRQRPGRP